MNFFSFLVEYLANERLKDMLKYNQRNISGTNKELVEQLVKHDSFKIKEVIKILNKSELVNLAKVFKIRSSGKKAELWSNLSKVFTFNKELFYQMVKGQITEEENKEIKSIIDALENLFYKDVGNIVHRLIYYSDYSKEIALKKIKKKHSNVQEKIIREVFDYVYKAYIEVIAIVKRNVEKYSDLGDSYWSYGKGRRSPNDFFSFEIDLSKKYPKIPKQMLLGIIEFNYFWYYLK